MKKLGLFLPLLFSFSIGFSAQADSIDYDKVCAKLKQCALEEYDNSGAPPEMKEMLIGMIDSQCAVMMSSYSTTLDQHGLVDEANACVKSMYNLSCSDLMGQDGQPETEECKEFEKKADAAGVSPN